MYLSTIRWVSNNKTKDILFKQTLVDFKKRKMGSVINITIIVTGCKFKVHHTEI